MLIRGFRNIRMLSGQFWTILKVVSGSEVLLVSSNISRAANFISPFGELCRSHE